MGKDRLSVSWNASHLTPVCCIHHKNLVPPHGRQEEQPDGSIKEFKRRRRLWIRLDAYEQDLTWLRYGQTVSVTTEWPDLSLVQ